MKLLNPIWEELRRFLGYRKKVALSKYEIRKRQFNQRQDLRCKVCEGSGGIPYTEIGKRWPYYWICTRCNGTGWRKSK